MSRFKERSPPARAVQSGDNVFIALANGLPMAYSYHQGKPTFIRVFDASNYVPTTTARDLPNLLDYLDTKAGLALWTSHSDPALGNGPRLNIEAFPSLQHVIAHAWQRYGIVTWQYNADFNWWFASLPIPFAPGLPYQWLVAKGVIYD